MNSEHSSPDAGNPRPAPTGRTRYIEPAPIMNVMFEQIEYLLAHSDSACPSGCTDCARLVQVRKWLLSPFNLAG